MTGVLARLRGLGARALHVRERRKALNDESLAQKISSEVFRDPALPKSSVNVNVEYGRAVLRGEVATTELVGELERRVRRVAGVRDVENLLHVPGAPVRMHQSQSSDTAEL
jgi:osmotically-inducible protein OsmY